MEYLLDSTAVIALLNDTASTLAERVLLHSPREIGISVIVMHELFYGAFKGRRKDHNVALIDELRFQVLEFSKEDARQAGEIRAVLAGRGTPIGPYDVLIAGQAKARGLTLVTSNIREFRRVPGLHVEDWNT